MPFPVAESNRHMHGVVLASVVYDNTYCGPNDWWHMPVYALRDTVIESGDRICQYLDISKFTLYSYLGEVHAELPKR